MFVTVPNQPPNCAILSIAFCNTRNSNKAGPGYVVHVACAQGQQSIHQNVCFDVTSECKTREAFYLFML